MTPTSEDQKQDDDIFRDLDEDTGFINKRTAVRYIRKDITTVVLIRSLFSASKLMVNLVDISSKGALIACSKKFPRNKNVSLQLIFKDGKVFRIDATIRHHRNSKGCYFYGLKFNHANDKLGEHLLNTQTDFLFKQ
ncbi:PilZ domain-containing protein [methane-oxidizing endosymbiont of Gigantopelta aegis]|uniref:PilZ domain-containing protein n=1 Tax=methane-oxidizing endosymbiont of Gigantopelta aegis TaxID=2794938 RepID=UPI0018DDF6D2|nr:PilZ domain-containing protein [methane-oxidizing endosymbiont of Gigantopelta aegis]